MAENVTVDSMIELQQLTLSSVDYFLFGSLIVLSLSIGLYFGFFSRQNSINDYLFGGKTMGYFPVAVSMLAGHTSGITLLGGPTEVYQHGSAYFLFVLPAFISCTITAYIFLPVFYKLQLPSVYEYLEIRFSRRIRTMASLLYLLSLISYIPLVVYVPSLALSLVTGYNIYFITPAICLICIIYTSLGGVKAVIWTDTVQFIFTTGSVVAICFIGIYLSGGIFNMWDIAAQGHRTQIFNWSPSLYVRKSFWGLTISYTIIFVTHLGISQNCVQRFLSIPSERNVKKSLLALAIGLACTKIICALTGLAMFARYRDCDPIQAKILERTDQILPYFVIDVAGHLSGLPGLFLAGLMSCALATMSSALNTLAGTIYDDFIEQWLPECTNKEIRATKIMKLTSIIVGIITMFLTFMVGNLGTIFEISISLRSAFEGPLIGLFIAGVMCPWIGRKGALTGCITAIIFMHWLIINNQWHVYHGNIKHSSLPTSTEKCPSRLKESLQSEESEYCDVAGNDEDVFFLFKISMLHFHLIGALITILTGAVTSYYLKEVDISKMNPNLITPLMQRFLSRKKYVEVPMIDIVNNDINDKEIPIFSQEVAANKTIPTLH